MNRVGKFEKVSYEQFHKDMKAEFYLPFAVDKAIKEGLANAKILPTDEKWQGVTYKDDVPVVENFLHENGRI